MGKAKKKSNVTTPKNVSETKENGLSHVVKRKVEFQEDPAPSTIKRFGNGMKPSPSMNTLSRLDRETVVLWRRPHLVIPYAIAELACLLYETFVSVMKRRLLVVTVSALSLLLFYIYSTPGPHQLFVLLAEKKLFWWGWWVLLGILSSIGLGSGLHTFLLYLGPHIAGVTLAAYECNSLDFPEPPYPDSIMCPSNEISSASHISLLAIVSKVRWESLLWGLGTAIGELPPYFMARASRISKDVPEDEEYREFLELLHGSEKNKKMGWLDKAKLAVESAVVKVGFWGILACASIPNPLFDLAGITCGHFLIPFWTFFGATIVGKAVIKMHIQRASTDVLLQMLFVVLAFSEHHVDWAVSQLGRVPGGDRLKNPLKDFLKQQKNSLHRAPGSQIVQRTTVVQSLLTYFVSAMVVYFCISIVHSLAQAYHKRLYEKSKRA